MQGTELKKEVVASSGSRAKRDQMNIVIIGHVDHGKSTVVGRLLADTGSLPQGKLAQVKAQCERNARPFEYAFLLDALQDEQAQGITIDSARCFFKSASREYIIIDAPGHIEFLKNMISGAARAEAALLVIDAKEGVRENSRRHGYLLGMLGIKQVAVCVNKLDLVGYDKGVFDAIVEEYSQFLAKTGMVPKAFIPISARYGDNMIRLSENMGWYNGVTVLGTLDGFTKELSLRDKVFRMPVQDVYKFTAQGDDRRIIAGRIETGAVSVGEEVVFYPSGKSSRIASIEEFNVPVKQSAFAGKSIGVTLETQIYVVPGELMAKSGQAGPKTGTQLRANIFWLGKHPLLGHKRYKMKLAGAQVPVWLKSIETVLDASELTTESNRQQIERHEVAQCVFETLKPVAFDLAPDIAQTGRFVLIDNYEIAGGGIITDQIETKTSMIAEHVTRRSEQWQRSNISAPQRAARYGQRAAMVLITGDAGTGKAQLAKALETDLFAGSRAVYYLGLSNSLLGVDSDIDHLGERDEYLRRLGEIAHLFTDAGIVLITTASDLDDHELEMLAMLNKPGDTVVVNIGPRRFNSREPDLQINDIGSREDVIIKIKEMLSEQKYLPEYNL
ncbi:MAG: adenylyl-sulfate kinase [Planctomycetes bacterium GWF2_50_10]|nr:MAG: adenylyl-sulfate kinase [Planctomycetes bacterium GWF2_50_10]